MRVVLRLSVPCQLFYVSNDFSPRLLKTLSPNVLSEHPSLPDATLPDATGKVLFPGTAPNHSAAMPINNSFTHTNPLLYLDTSLFQQCRSAPVWIRTHSTEMTHMNREQLADHFITKPF